MKFDTNFKSSNINYASEFFLIRRNWLIINIAFYILIIEHNKIISTQIILNIIYTLWTQILVN